jgi:hypothetical protein
MASKTKIVKLESGAKITVVSKKEDNFAYGFRRTGKTTVAVATAICVDYDKFKHNTARNLIAERFDFGQTSNLRIDADYDGEDVADRVENAMYYGNVGYFGKE